MQRVTLSLWLSLAGVFLQSGCASLVYENAKYSTVLKPASTRGEIRAALGKPVESGRVGSRERLGYAGKPFDEFYVKGPVYDRELANQVALGTVMSFGVGGVTMLPDAAKWSSSNSEKVVKVIYDESGTYLHHDVKERSVETRQTSR